MCFNKFILFTFFLFKEKARKKIKNPAGLSACADFNIWQFRLPEQFSLTKARKNYSEPRRRVPKYDFIFERVRAEAKILFLIITQF